MTDTFDTKGEMFFESSDPYEIYVYTELCDYWGLKFYFGQAIPDSKNIILRIEAPQCMLVEIKKEWEKINSPLLRDKLQMCVLVHRACIREGISEEEIDHVYKHIRPEEEVEQAYRIHVDNCMVDGKQPINRRSFFAEIGLARILSNGKVESIEDGIKRLEFMEDEIRRYSKRMKNKRSVDD